MAAVRGDNSRLTVNRLESAKTGKTLEYIFKMYASFFVHSIRPKHF